MTDREKAIIMAYSGKVTLTGENLDAFYEYVKEIIGRPVYTHELPFLSFDIKEKSKDDFFKIWENCREDMVFCVDCKHLMFSDMYGECSKCNEGIVQPWDWCREGERKGE